MSDGGGARDLERSPAVDEAEQLIAVLEGDVLHWLRLARGAQPAAALGYREMAADQLMVTIEHSRRLVAMVTASRRVTALVAREVAG